MIVHGEAEKFGEEATVAYFKVLSWHLPGISEETKQNLKQDRQCSGHYSNTFESTTFLPETVFLLCIFRSFTIFTIHLLLLFWINQGE
jgi:hypothetical protein